MERELPSPRPCPARLLSYTSSLGLLEQGRITFAPGLGNLVPQRTVCKDNQKADMMTSRLEIKHIP